MAGMSELEERIFVLANATRLEEGLKRYYQFPDSYNVFATPAASVDFIVFSDCDCALPRKSIPLSPLKIMGYEILLNDPDDQKDLELDAEVHGAILNEDQVSPVPSPNTVFIEIEHGKSVAVLVTKQRRVRLEAGTKQCIGYTQPGVRCKNRRRSAGEAIWCHHHSWQETEFKEHISGMAGDCHQVPSWW